MARKLFSVNPPIDVDLFNHGALGDIAVRADIGADGTFETFFDFLGGQGTWDDHLVLLLQAAGRSDVTTRQQAVALLIAKKKEEMDMTVKDAWNAVMKALCEFINVKWKPAGSSPIPSGTSYQTAEEFFTALLAKTQAEVVDGKLVLKIP